MESQTIAVPERYRVIGVLGSGGMSHVYQAHDSILDKTVAIKILQVEVGPGTDDHVMRFQREAKATASLKHDNIVSILDFGLTADAVPYMVLDHLEGKSLKELIDGNGPFTLEKALPVFQQVCAGLAHAHKNGIIHRDLKPSNIIFAKDQSGCEVVKVIDFGIARLEENSSLTTTNAVIGSPPYMSPEQASGKPIGITSDVYSLGCVIFETLAGKPPFQGNTSVETIMMHVNDVAPKLSDVADGDFPSALEQLVSKLLQKDPADRFQSMEQVTSALHDIDPRTATGISTLQASEAVDTKTEFLQGALIVVISIGLVMATVAGSVLMLDYYINENEKPSFAGKHVKFAKPTDLKAMLDPTILPDRNDSFLKKTYSNDTTTKTLNLVQCPITDKGIGYIKHLPLELLDIRFCSKVTDESLPVIGKMEPLQELRLDDIKHEPKQGSSSFESFSNLKHLTNLSVDGLSLSQDDFVALGKIPNLQTLRLNRIRGVTKDNLLALSKMPSLTTIELGGNHHSTETFSALAQIKSLESLGLNRAQLSDPDLPALVQVKQLRRLSLSRTMVTDKGILVLTNMPNLTQLSLIKCPNITLKGKQAFHKVKPECIVKLDDANMKGGRYVPPISVEAEAPPVDASQAETLEP